MRNVRMTLVGLALVLGACSVLAAQTLSGDRLRQQRQMQEQVRDLVRNLAAEVLDLQLQQLRENRLDSHPCYEEINTMREHLDELVDNEMEEVVALLDAADLGDEAQRAKVVQDARLKSRQIVERLLEEQRVLLRRLKMAELVRQLQRLIQHQTKVFTSTEVLIQQPSGEQRQELNLATLEDQTLVGVTFGHFQKNLREVSGLGEVAGREAAEALRIVEKEQVDKLLSAAETGLRQGEFLTAAGKQKAVLDVLRSLLARIQNGQKAMESGGSVEQKIAAAIIKQAEIRDESGKKPLDADTADKLAKEQNDLAKQIADLQKATPTTPELQKALEAAAKDAQKTAENLLEMKPAEAKASADKATENLKEAAKAAEEQAKASQAKSGKDSKDGKGKDGKGKDGKGKDGKGKDGKGKDGKGKDGKGKDGKGKDGKGKDGKGKGKGGQGKGKGKGKDGKGKGEGEGEGEGKEESKSPSQSKKVGKKSGRTGGTVDASRLGLPPSDALLAETEKLREEPWFAKLPSDTRDAIRTNSQRRPPPGYQRRIEEYFQNTDR